MTQNNNFSVLPFYKNILEQNHRKSYAYGAIYALYTPKGRIPPFQIMRESRAEAIVSVLMYTSDGVLLEDITAAVIDSGVQIVQGPGFQIIVYPSFFPMDIEASQGMYYVVVSDGVDTWYSDIFTMVLDVSQYTKIEWYDVENLIFDSGAIIYKDPTFKNIVYFPNEIGKPEYKFDEEGEERDGFFFPEKQLSEKVYKMTVLAPEYLCDAMRLVRMSDFVVITDKYNRVYECDTFLFTPKWETQGDLASVEIEFETNTVVKRTGKLTSPGVGDFNQSFNEDFNN